MLQPTIAPLAISTASLVALSLLIPSQSQAQITPSGLGTQVNGSGTAPCTTGTCTISNGIVNNNGNWFLQFSDFSTDGITNTIFDTPAAPPDVSRIIILVEGMNESFINSPITVINNTLSPDLLFMNPNGIRFGPNADLNIPGSFIASTANRILFDKNIAVPVNTDGANLLGLNIPSGLQLPSQVRPIQVESGSNLSTSMGEAFAFIGGDITITDSFLTAQQGRMELGSVGAGSIVDIGSSYELDYSSVQSFLDINISSPNRFTQISTIGGDLQIYGRNITLTGDFGSSFSTSTSTSGVTPGSLDIFASEKLTLDGPITGLVPDGPITGLVPPLTGVFAQSTGSDSGPININANRLVMQNGAWIINSVTATGTSSSININSTFADISDSLILSESQSGTNSNAGNIKFSGNTFNLNNALISTSTNGSGNAGNINVNFSGNISLNNALITTSTMNIGNSGDINLSGNIFNADNSQVSTSTVGTGNGGNITVSLASLNMENDSAIEASSLSTSRGGDLFLDVEKNILLRFNSDIRTNTLAGGTAGDITLDVGGFVLAVLEEDSDVTAAAGMGTGGTIQAKAQGIYGFRQFEGSLTPESDFENTGGIQDINVETAPETEPPDSGLLSSNVAEGCSAAALAAAFNEDNNEPPSSLQVIGGGGIPSQPSSPSTNNNLWIIPVDPLESSDESRELDASEAIATGQPTERRAVALFCTAG